MNLPDINCNLFWSVGVSFLNNVVSWSDSDETFAKTFAEEYDSHIHVA